MRSFSDFGTRPGAALWFLETFPDHSFKKEFEQAQPYGAVPSDHAKEFLLSPCGAVFALREREIVAVMTKEKAIGNAQRDVRGFGHNKVRKMFKPAPAPTPCIRQEDDIPSMQHRARELGLRHAMEDHQTGVTRFQRHRYPLVREALGRFFDIVVYDYDAAYCATRYSLKNPSDGQPVAQPEDGWRWPKATMQQKVRVTGSPSQSVTAAR